MHRTTLFLAVALAGGIALGASSDDREKAPREEPAGGHITTVPPVKMIPPVLRRLEPDDDVMVTLPGPAAAKVIAPPPPAPVPAPAAPVPVAENIPKPAPVPDPDEEARPILHRAPRPIYPAEFEKDSAFFAQKRIGEWNQPDAYNLFGEALRERPAIDDDMTVNGRIYAFSDPTGRYRELELDFDSEGGMLRTVFVYPWKMSWKDCIKLWGTKVNSTDASKGRIFYSYMNRHLDVLVDPAGKVISLGLY